MLRRFVPLSFFSNSATPQRDGDLNALIDVLLHSYPNDILTVCRRREKFPVYPHVTRPWTWGDFLKILTDEKTDARFLAKYDVGILLHDLCVVDVDSVELATELEAAFPVLLAVPCEKTAKGFHYYFQRSQLADDRGYFDGAGQVGGRGEMAQC